MFGKRKKSSAELEAVNPVSDFQSEKAPRIEFIDEFNAHTEKRRLQKALVDIDTSDPGAIRILYRDEWKTLQRYRTRAVVNIFDITFRGGWYPSPYRKTEEANWHEMLVASASLQLGSSSRLYSFFEWENPQHRPKSGARFSVYEARYDEVTICENLDFEKQNMMARETRSLDDRYIGSPVKLFSSAEEADEFIKLEIMSYSETAALLTRQVAAKAGKPQQYNWPEVVFTNEIYPYNSTESIGFYGSQVRLPSDVFCGLRRSLADFRNSLRLTVDVELELLGLDVVDPHPAPGHAVAGVSLIPRDAQITGKIREVSARWAPESAPFSNPRSLGEYDHS